MTNRNMHLEKAVFKYILNNNDIKDIKTFIEKYKYYTQKIDYKYLKKEHLQYSSKKDINQPYVSRMFKRFNIYKDKSGIYNIAKDTDILDIQKILINELTGIPISCHDIIEIPYDKNEKKTGLFILTLDVPMNMEHYIANVIYKALHKPSNKNSKNFETLFNAIIPGFRSVTILSQYHDNIIYIYNIFKNKLKQYQIEECSIVEFDWSSLPDNLPDDIYSDDIQFAMYAALGDKDVQEYLDNCHDFDDNQDEISNSNKSINKESTIDYDNFFDEEFKKFLDDCEKY